MGNCGSYDDVLTNNEMEDFIRVILMNLKARQMNFLGIITEFKKDVAFDKTKFMSNYFYDDSIDNDYLIFHQSLANIQNDFQQLSDQQFTILLMLSFSRDSSHKPLWLKEAFGIKTLEDLWNYMKYYFYINLILLNEAINEKLSKFQKKMIIRNKYIDDNCKYLCEKLLVEVYNQKNLDNFSSKVYSDILELVDQNLLKQSEGVLPASFWDAISHKFDFLFNCIELRHYFYINYCSEK